MVNKIYKLKPHEIALVALGHGGCLATDLIVVDGARVGYMYREQPVRPEDSGWRFFAGEEDAAYMSQNERHGVYDVNTLVNDDPDILPHLGASFGSRFERDASGQLRELPQNE